MLNCIQTAKLAVMLSLAYPIKMFHPFSNLPILNLNSTEYNLKPEMVRKEKNFFISLFNLRWVRERWDERRNQIEIVENVHILRFRFSKKTKRRFKDIVVVVGSFFTFDWFVLFLVFDLNRKGNRKLWKFLCLFLRLFRLFFFSFCF